MVLKNTAQNTSFWVVVLFLYVTNIKYAIRMEKEKIEKRGTRTKVDFSISQLRNSEIAVDTS